MSYIVKEKNAQVNTGDLNVSITPPTSGIKKDCRMTTMNVNFTIPAGAYYVEIRHSDPQKREVTVNGAPLSYNDKFADTSQINKVTNKQDFCPAIAVANPRGARLDIMVSYPSDSAVDPCTIV